MALGVVVPTLIFLATSSRRDLHATYHEALARVRASVTLSSEQSHRLSELFLLRESQERHLRKQMRTTYTPVQQQKARRLWQERDGKRLTSEQRRLIWAQLRVTPSQQAQFQAYEARLRQHREETLAQASALLSAEQQPRLITALNGFEQL